MKVEDAVRHCAKSVVPVLKGKDAIAVHVLVETGRRVLRARKAIRQLADAVDPETRLNQQEFEMMARQDEKGEDDV